MFRPTLLVFENEETNFNKIGWYRALITISDFIVSQASQPYFNIELPISFTVEKVIKIFKGMNRSSTSPFCITYFDIIVGKQTCQVRFYVCPKRYTEGEEIMEENTPAYIIRLKWAQDLLKTMDTMSGGRSNMDVYSKHLKRCHFRPAELPKSNEFEIQAKHYVCRRKVFNHGVKSEVNVI
jgi:hypothetical protein